MSQATIETSQKIKLYLAARGYTFQDYVVCAEGKCWKDNSGRFTIKSKLRYVKSADGQLYSKLFKTGSDGQPVTEEEACKCFFFGYLKSSRVHICPRCGGAGGSAHWPGYTCFECGGNGVDPKFDWEKALTKALDGEDFEGDYAAKVQAKQEARKAADARFIEEQAAARKECSRKFKEDNAELIERAKNALAIIGLGATGEWGEKLRDIIQAGNSDTYVPQGGNAYFKQIEGICKAIEFRQLENERLAATSQHVGKLKERSDFTARVQFVKEFEREYGTSHLTVLHDDDGNVLKYWNTINLPDPIEGFPKNKRPAVKGERVSFSAMVVDQDEYRGVKQTQLQRVTKARLA